MLAAAKGAIAETLLSREMRRGAEPEMPYDDWPEGLKLGECRLAFDGVNLAFAAGGQGFGGSGAAVEGGEMDIWIQPLDGSAPPRALISTPAYESDAVFSPDNRWLAYTSNESGRNEVYVRRHSVDGGVAGKSIQVSGADASARKPARCHAPVGSPVAVAAMHT